LIKEMVSEEVLNKGVLNEGTVDEGVLDEEVANEEVKPIGLIGVQELYCDKRILSSTFVAKGTTLLN
jgi:hypothetical protein